MRNRIEVMAIIITILFFFSVKNIFAEIKRVEVGIEGLSCPFCVWGVEKKLKAVKSIDKIDIHLKQAKLDLYLKRSTSLDITAIKKAIKKAGFSARYIRIEAKGNLREKNGNILFRIRETNQEFLVYESEVVPKAKLNDLLKKSVTILIEGNIHEHKEFGPALEIDKMELAD